MPNARAQPIDWPATPEAAFAAWTAEPVLGPPLVLWSGDRSAQARGWSRWTVLGLAADATIDSLDGLALAASSPSDAAPGHEGAPPFTGGWIGWLSYDLGPALEPACSRGRRVRTDGAWPLVYMRRCDAALVHDAHTGVWWRIGDDPRLNTLVLAAGPGTTDRPAAYRLGTLVSSAGEIAYTAAVARAVEYIHAGDAFQVNLAHHLRGSFRGDPGTFFADLVARASPRYGALVDAPPDGAGVRRTLVSASPELFLSYDPLSRRVVTRPMKGTRPLGSPGGERELRESEKETAELSMIVDLMRNDIGRVSAPASVRVDEPRVLERHGDDPGAAGSRGVLQGVATVSGTLAPGLNACDLLRAAFPGGSVTGAPKVRAMQIIEELEPLSRGPYCGAIGFLSDSGHAAFSIAIRTALLEGPTTIGGGIEGTLDYPVGAGIVADSSPQAEWRETMDKAATILAMVDSQSSDRPPHS